MLEKGDNKEVSLRHLAYCDCLQLSCVACNIVVEVHFVSLNYVCHECLFPILVRTYTD